MISVLEYYVVNKSETSFSLTNMFGKKKKDINFTINGEGLSRSADISHHKFPLRPKSRQDKTDTYRGLRREKKESTVLSRLSL